MTKILLSVCTVCAVGASRDARAQSAQPPGQNPPTQAPPPTVPPPIPTDTPAPTLPSKPGDIPQKPDDPAVPTSTPTSPAVPPVTDPNAPVPPPPDTAPAPPVPVTSSTTTTTTTTTTTDADIGGETDIYAWSEPLLPSGIGVSAILGGGVGGFTDKQMRTTTSDIGGLWDLRVALGSHLPLALEVGYMGSATNINGLPTGNKGRLIGTTVEAALRYNILPHMPFTPYVFAGMGWQRYDVTNTSVSLADSGVRDHDNLMVFPMGVGLAYRLSGFVADVRGTFRYTTDNDLVLSDPTLTQPAPTDFAPMHSWEASAAVGYEF
jgi:opacity protein-like surface antigen